MRPLLLLCNLMLGVLCWLAIGTVVWLAWQIVMGW